MGRACAKTLLCAHGTFTLRTVGDEQSHTHCVNQHVVLWFLRCTKRAHHARSGRRDALGLRLRLYADCCRTCEISSASCCVPVYS